MTGPKRSEMLQRLGHAGGHLRDALLNALAIRKLGGSTLRLTLTWNVISAGGIGCQIGIGRRWLLGQLWNCTDVVPSSTRNEVAGWFPDATEPVTYSQLARLLAQELKTANAA